MELFHQLLRWRVLYLLLSLLCCPSASLPGPRRQKKTFALVFIPHNPSPLFPLHCTVIDGVDVDLTAIFCGDEIFPAVTGIHACRNYEVSSVSVKTLLLSSRVYDSNSQATCWAGYHRCCRESCIPELSMPSVPWKHTFTSFPWILFEQLSNLVPRSGSVWNSAPPTYRQMLCPICTPSPISCTPGD